LVDFKTTETGNFLSFASEIGLVHSNIEEVCSLFDDTSFGLYHADISF